MRDSYFVIVFEPVETQHDEGISIVPFRDHAAAVEYAAAVAEHLNIGWWNQACDEQAGEDLTTILDEYNAICEHCNCEQVKVISGGFNDPAFVLDDPFESKLESGLIQYADNWNR
jgi:hypothetical protein